MPPHCPNCLAIGTLAVLALVGCGTGPDRLTPVRGTVYYHGVPLQGGTIVFTPDQARGGFGSLARAEIEPDGHFVLRTGDRFGAVPGWHRVTVVAVETTGAPAGSGYTTPRSLLPVKYCDPEMSGVSYEVKEGEENTLELNLD